MAASFTTKLSLGQKAFCVENRTHCDYCVRELTVGQLRVVETLPKAADWCAPLYREEYMCIETGVGSGKVWTYGHNIFSNEADAQSGVKAHEQLAWKQRSERDKDQAERAERQRALDLIRLRELQAKYPEGTL